MMRWVSFLSMWYMYIPHYNLGNEGFALLYKMCLHVPLAIQCSLSVGPERHRIKKGEEATQHSFKAVFLVCSSSNCSSMLLH